MPFYVHHYNHTLNTTITTIHEEFSGNIIWFVINVLLITITISGNLLTITAILCCRKLSNMQASQFIFSLAVSDLFVGLTMPYHMAFYILEDFGDGKWTCLMRFVLVSLACASSITNLLVIAADRYLAIVYPLHYNRLMTRRSARVLTVFAWSLSFTLAAILLVWNGWREGVGCEVFEVIPNKYLYFVVCPMFVVIWLMMLLIYSKICQEAAGHAKRLRGAGSVQNVSTLKDSKSCQVMLTILGCFTICWLPYFVIAIYTRHARHPSSALYYEIAFNLAVANSGMNPITYAWKNHNFRAAFLQLMRCRSPNTGLSAQQHYVTDHVPSKNGANDNSAVAPPVPVDNRLELKEVTTSEKTKSDRVNGIAVRTDGNGCKDFVGSV